MKDCIFACGGHGSRMGAELPKQFLRFGERTVLQLSVEKMLKAEPGVRIIIALPSEYVLWWREECQRMEFEIEHTVVPGGITRFHSVRNALKEVRDGALVAVHDAVRPFVSEELVRRLFTEAENYGSAVPVVPVTDTLKALRRSDDGTLSRIDGMEADRTVLYGAQTPQIFREDILRTSYDHPYDTRFTDDASVVEAAGYELHYSEGEKYNIKLTTPEDMLFAGRFLL